MPMRGTHPARNAATRHGLRLPVVRVTAKGLTFTEGTHRYRLDGVAVPSVTTLLSGGIPKPAIASWAAKMVAEHAADNDGCADCATYGEPPDRGRLIGHLKGVPWQKRDEAAVRGTDVHALAEHLVHGRSVEVPDVLAERVDGYVRWLDLWQPTAILTEQMCASREWWYAGKFDLIADMAGERWLLDFKTSRAVYGETALQCAAYRGSEFYVDDDGVEQPMPEGITRLGVVHITPLSTVLYPLASGPEPFQDFLHAAWTAKRKKHRDAYVAAPLTSPTESDGA